MKCDSGVGAFEKAHAFNEIFGERPKTFHSLSRQAGHLRSAAGNSGHVVNTFVRNECAVHIKRDESDILDRELCGKPQTVDRFSLSLRFKLIGCCGVNSFYPQCRRLWMKKYRFRFGSSTQIKKIGQPECWTDQQQILHDEIVLRTIRDDGEVPDSLSQP